MDDIFPYQKDINYNNLKLTTEGKYSITKRKDGEKIISIMKNVIGDLSGKTITDATACVGGDSINFALNYRYVNSIEVNKENFEALENNVNEYELTNINLYQQDAVSFFNWTTDVLYVDPPWGGVDYKQHKQMDLNISSKRLDEWIEEILLRKNRPSYIFLKLPHNFNFDRFNILSNVEFIRPYRIRSYFLIVISVHMPVSK